MKKESKTNEKKYVYVMDDSSWQDWIAPLVGSFDLNTPWAKWTTSENQNSLANDFMEGMDECIFIPVRGAGPARFIGDELKQTQVKRRYFLLGQTLDGMQTWDLLQGIRAVQTLLPSGHANGEIRYMADSSTAVKLAYASLFTEADLQLYLKNPTISHRDGPYYLNVLRHMDIPAAILMSAKKHDVTIKTEAREQWDSIADLGARIPGMRLSVSE